MSRLLPLLSDLSFNLFSLPPPPRQKLTEQRVPVFSHEIVPDYLRTKPDPEVEEQEKQLSAEAARIGPEVAQVRWFSCSWWRSLLLFLHVLKAQFTPNSVMFRHLPAVLFIH